MPTTPTPPARFPAGTPLYVAFTGPAGSGKTTHARALQARFHGDVLSFATPLKKIAREVFGDQLDDPAFARGALQALGVAVRGIDRDTWVKLLLSKISPDRPVFVDDCRFYNEYQALRQRGFVFVRLGASMRVLGERRPGMTDAQRLHASEVESATIPGDIVEWTEDEMATVSGRIVAALDRLRPEILGAKPEKPGRPAAK